MFYSKRIKRLGEMVADLQAESDLNRSEVETALQRIRELEKLVLNPPKRKTRASH